MDDLRTRLDTICAGLPGAEKSDPWGGGHEAWKVGGKLFASIGAVTPGVSVKCRDVETARMLIDAGIGSKAPYFHASWVLLGTRTETDELEHRTLQAYDIVRAGLTRKLQATLPPRPGKED